MATRPALELPDPLLAILPSDPFEQLDIARKITSIALSTRVSALESEASKLRRSLAQKDDEIAQLTAQVHALDASLTDLSTALARAEEEKATLVNENVSLSNTVKKLNRDVSKLQVFKKTLMQSLQEEEDNPTGASNIVPPKLTSPPDSIHGEEEDLPSPAKLSAENELSETGSSVPEDGAHGDIDSSEQATSLTLPSLNSTPRLTPPGSPPRLTAALSPPRVSRPLDPRRHSISVGSMRNMSNDRSLMFSSVPSGHQSGMTSPFEAAESQTGRTRVDGKEFFRQVRSRLSYEQFTSFLANVKELNSHKQTREETLGKAEEIFGPDNKDLFAIFEGLITRNL